MKRCGFRRLRLVLASLATLCLSACGDYGIELPGKYELVRIYASAILIAGPKGGIVIHAHVDGYAVIGDVVAGHVARADLSPEREQSVPGFFVLNTQTHAVAQGLDKTAWLAALQREGIGTEPVLGTPSRYDRTYGPSGQQGVSRIVTVLYDMLRIIGAHFRAYFE